MAWTWRCHGGDAEVEGFPNQADAETWLGEHWRELADEGVSAVTLLDGDREVYGPMSLSPA